MNQPEILFKKFSVIECLKKDQDSCVYLAKHIHLDKEIILKTLAHPDQEMLVRFKREARLLAKLNHPNIINVLDFGIEDQSFYISFEYVAGQTLREVIEKNEIGLERKKEIIAQIIEGLMAAHSQGIIHRDIKPENILIADQVKIADFGLALEQHDVRVTMQSSIMGTPAYLAPEQISGESLTTQSDLFSLGIVIYELLSGKHPFLGADITTTINQISLHDFMPDLGILPRPLDIVVGQLLQKRASQRPKTLQEIYHHFGSGEPLPTKVEEKKRAHHFYIYLIIGAIAIVIYWVWPQTSETILEPDPQAQNLLLTDSSTIVSKPELPDTSNQIAGTTQQVEIEKSEPGLLMLEVQPWARVWIDGHYHDTTPLQGVVSLEAGDHTLKLEHPDYPAYTKNIRIEPEKTNNIRVKMDTLYGYLLCQIHPWADLYVDNQFAGQTPLAKPIILLPGKYELTLENPAFTKKTEQIVIDQQDTLIFRHRFNP